MVVCMCQTVFLRSRLTTSRNWNRGERSGKGILEIFFVNDELGPQIAEICSEAFNFQVPLNYLNGDTAVLEVISRAHGCFQRCRRTLSGRLRFTPLGAAAQ